MADWVGVAGCQPARSVWACLNSGAGGILWLGIDAPHLRPSTFGCYLYPESNVYPVVLFYRVSWPKLSHDPFRLELLDALGDELLGKSTLFHSFNCFLFLYFKY